MNLVAGRLHSAVDIIAQGGQRNLRRMFFLRRPGRNRIPPEQCLVIEDECSPAPPPRARARNGLPGSGSRHGDDAAMRAAGAIPFRSMHDFPALPRTALE